MSSLVVLKFGGQTLATPTKIQNVAQLIQARRRTGDQVVAVVSAMGTMTNELIQLSQQVSARPSLRESDMLLSVGERISMSLLSMALNDLKCPAISLTGSQAGIVTSSTHSQALVKEVRGSRVAEALQQNQVVVVAGFQGVSEEREITTIGRGGSDVTAVAMAHHLRANCCEIVKEVAGVFTADPHLVPGAKALPEISYPHLMELCFWGAKMLHFRAAELAARNSIPLLIGTASSHTQIKESSVAYESQNVLAVSSHPFVSRLEISSSLATALPDLEGALNSFQIPAVQILNANSTTERSSIWVAAPEEISQRIHREFRDAGKISVDSKLYASVTCTATGTANSELAQQILRTCSTTHVPVYGLLVSPSSFTVIVPRDKREACIRAVHSLIA